MTTIVADDLPAAQAIPDALQKLRVQIRTMVERGHPDQFVAAIAQAFAGLPIHIQNGPILIVEKECIGCVIHQDAEACLTRAELQLGLPQLGDVLHDAKLPQRPSRVVPGHIAMAVNGSHGSVRARHLVLYVVTWTAEH